MIPRNPESIPEIVGNIIEKVHVFMHHREGDNVTSEQEYLCFRCKGIGFEEFSVVRKLKMKVGGKLDFHRYSFMVFTQ